MSFTVLSEAFETVEDEVLSARVDIHALKMRYIAMRDKAEGEDKAKLRKATSKLDAAESLLSNVGKLLREADVS